MQNNLPPTEILKAFTEKPEPMDYVLPGMLAGTVGGIISPGGLGKSMFALQLAVQIAGGPDILGLGKLKGGSVAYLPAEDPPESIKHRMYMLGPYLSDKEKKEVSGNLLVQPLFGRHPNLLEEKSFKYIKNLSKNRRLVIIDTLRRFHREDENTSGAMTEVISRMETICVETNCSFIFIHHSSKSSSYNSQEKQPSSRGSSVLVDNIRWQAHLMAMTKKEMESIGRNEKLMDFFVRFSISKQNYGPPLPEIWLRRHDGGILRDIYLK